MTIQTDIASKVTSLGDNSLNGINLRAAFDFMIAYVDAAGGAETYESSWTLTSFSSEYEFVHSLSSEPKKVELWMKCITATEGHSVGDILKVQDMTYLQIKTDATKVYIKTRNNFYLYVLSGYALVSTSEAKWHLQVRAEV